MIDLTLLRIIKYKEQFVKVSKYIPDSAIDKRTKAITADIKKYFELSPEEEVLDFSAFRSMFFTTFHKGLKEEDCKYYNTVISRMEQDVPDSIRNNIVNQLLELEFATKVGNLINNYDAGEEVDVIHEVSGLVTEVKDTLTRRTNFEFADVEDSTLGESVDEGMKWPLKILNDHYRPIQGGDQYIIAARPGKGKTSFITFLLASIAKGMDSSKSIIWLNNESKRQRVMSRQIMSALRVTTKEAQQLKAEGSLVKEYTAVMGSSSRVKVFDIHGKSTAMIEELLEAQEGIGAIVFDMLDNIPSNADGRREDQRLEKLYQWARELGVHYDCPSFPTSQVNKEGDGEMFPTDSMLKESSTGKQGACDGIIMLGHSNDPMMANKRGLSMVKTKSRREGMCDMREEIVFDEDVGVFYDSYSLAERIAELKKSKG